MRKQEEFEEFYRKKVFLFSFLAFLVLLAVTVLLCGCNKECVHEYSSATCTELATCTICKETTGFLAAHKYSEATCKDLATCSVCQATTGELAEHKYSEATCKDLATCTVCQATTGEFAEHKYSEATCKDLATCSVCQATTGELAEHKFSEATCEAPATCGVCGLTDGEALEHQYSSATCTELATCSFCGGTTGELEEHKYSNATCQQVPTCNVCGAKSGSKGNHNYSKGTCTYCGAQDAKYKEIYTVLSRIERYPVYLGLDIDILDCAINIYKISGKYSEFLDIIDQVGKMSKEISSIYTQVIKYPVELDWLVDACEKITVPVYTGSESSYLSACRMFNTNVKTLCVYFNLIAQDYGVPHNKTYS